MATEFDDWLRQLAAAGKGGSALSAKDIPAAIRGNAWSLILVLPGDFSAATISGTLRASPDASTALATLSFTALTYDAGTNKTTTTGSLAAGTGANSTGILPADADGNGVLELPLAIYLTPSGGTNELLLGGKFTLLGKV